MVSSGTTKHELMLETARDRIRSGQFRPGERMPTDAKLVREFNVSRPTVAKALQTFGGRPPYER